MFQAACPSCGGAITFRSQTSILCVCPYCRSNVVRHGKDLELIGKQSDLQPDMSPIQIGAFGKFKNKSFQVVGRQILAWSDGRWNEWYIVFGDGSSGWLAEAQGEFFINFPKPELLTKIDPKSKKIQTNDRRFVEVDSKVVECIASEGELPFKVIPGYKSHVKDFSDFMGGFASLEQTDDGLLIHIGEITSLKKLSMSGLKHFEGWGRF